MNNQPHIFVAGFGRCGTSAMMQMLWHGGCKTAGKAPAFEDTRLSVSNVDLAWLEEQRGTAVKLLLPVARPLTGFVQAKTIWMDRNFKDQARSQIKMLRAFSDPETTGNIPDSAIGKFTRQMQRERPVRMGELRKLGPVLVVRFKDLLKDPTGTAQRVQKFLGEDLMPDDKQAANAVIARSHRCAPDMRMEAALLNAYDDMGTGA